MDLFQNELDIATIEFDHQLKVSLEHFFNTTNYKIVTIDMFTCGLLLHSMNAVCPKDNYLGGVVCHSSRALPLLINAPASFATRTFSNNYSEECAQYMAKKNNADIGVCLQGISSFPDENNIVQSKVFIGYYYNQQKCNKVLECSGNKVDVYKQSIYATLGFLKMLYMTYPIDTKKV